MANNTNLNELPGTGQLAAEQYNKRAEQFLTEAKSFVIDSQEMAVMAADDLKKIKAYAKDVDEKRKSLTKPLDDVKKGIMDLFRPAVDYLEKAEAALKKGLGDYANAEEKKRREAEAIARKAAQEEAAKLAAAAKDAAEKGQAEAARALEQQAAMAPAVIAIPAPAPKLSGISSTMVWKFEITDKAAFIKAVAEGKIPLAAVDINDSFVRNQTRALKAELNYPGVRVYEERQIGARTA